MLGDPVGVVGDHDASAGKFEGVGIAADVRATDACVIVAPEVDAIAGALSILIDDGNMRRRVGERARELAERQYSTTAMAQRLSELYASLSPLRVEQKT